MSHSASNQQPQTPDQLIRLFRLRSGGNAHKKMRQTDMATLVGVDTRTLQQWENGERLPGADSLQRLIRVLVTEKLFLPGEEPREARHLWEMVSRAFNERPGTYRLYPLFDEHWFAYVLRTSVQEPGETVASPEHQQLLPPRERKAEERPDGERDFRQTLTNLSAQRTSFIGRAQEITEIKHLLVANALVTLTGPGGCGKTRLALHTAKDLLDRYTDGSGSSSWQPSPIPPWCPLLSHRRSPSRSSQVFPFRRHSPLFCAADMRSLSWIIANIWSQPVPRWSNRYLLLARWCIC